MNTREYYTSVSILRKNFLVEDRLRVINGRRIKTSFFAWPEPAAEAAVTVLERDLGRELPIDLGIFLTSVSNGPTLYRNVDDAMTGYKIYAIDEFLEKDEHWRTELNGLWQDTFMAI